MCKNSLNKEATTTNPGNLGIETKTRIEALLEAHPAVLFMKGTPESPLCGFSARAVTILKKHSIPFHGFNVLEDEDIRQGIKEYGKWPTLPQLYVKKKLIGGSDILMEMHQAGELPGGLLNSL